MDIINLKYNKLLMQTKARLERELKETNKLIEEQQEECNHVNVILGFSGSYPNRDTIHRRCILCGEEDSADLPWKKEYPPIDAIYYKKDEYHFGRCTITREKKFEELQNLWMQYAEKFAELTIEQLIEKMNQIIKKDENQAKELEKKLDHKI